MIGSVLVLLLSILAPSAISAQEAAVSGEPPAEPAAPLILATKEAPPFAMKTEDGRWTGITVDLVRLLADDLGRPLEIRETALAGLLRGVEEGRFDLAAAALTITAERERRVDFSHSYFSSGLGIATVRKPQGWLAVARGFFSLQLLQVVMGLVGLLFAVGLVVWLFERGQNPKQFGGSPSRGIGSGFWWSAVTMTTVGYGDKAPVSFGGRLVALLWMFASLIAISTFTAAIASALTVSRLEAVVEGPEDLPRATVGAVTDTTGALFLEDETIDYRGFSTPAEAMEALIGGDLDAVVHDAPILAYLARGLEAGSVEVLPERLDTQEYGIALPSESDLREPLNRALLERVGSPAWERLVASYLGG
ncbi:MAG: transporter substrate-binding domain-containing protein [Thermoanaerobaculia bacterium]|nr:transporter substrate-binding domain-containing protein [Thermoanaerobaculia bacterium]